MSRLVERSFQTSVLQTIVDGTARDSSKGSRFLSVGLAVAYLVYLIFYFNKMFKSLGDTDGAHDFILVAFCTSLVVSPTRGSHSKASTIY